MTRKISQPSIIPPWTKVFSELAMRGLLRVHHDYLLWSMSQLTNEEPDFASLNNSPGVAYADEPTVCAAISQEFLYSRYSSGVWMKGVPSMNIKEGRRYYRIQREEKYPNSIQRADFRIDRLKRNGNHFPNPVYLEAKRAFRWSTKLNSKQNQIENLLNEIKEDITKLRELTLNTKPRKDKPFGYLLIWNVSDKKNKKTDLTPSRYLSKLGNKDIHVKQIRVAPLSCQPFDNKKKMQDLKIERCVWLALVEVSRP